MIIISILNIIPLTLFMLTARLQGMTELAWQDAFIFAGACALLVCLIQLYKQIVIDRLMLGIHLFLIIGAAAFLTQMYSLLYYFAMYKGVVFLSCIALVGLVSTLFSPSGFIGIKSNEDNKVRYYSLWLLVATISSMFWSYGTNQYGLMVSIVIPVMLLRIMNEEFKKRI